MQPTVESFSQRKKDHIEISLREESQSTVDHFSRIELQHCALPEINFEDVSIQSQVFGHCLKSPLFISSMTLGHGDATAINHSLARCAEQRGWMMGVGSQRRQLFDSTAKQECEKLRQAFPDLVLFGNIGLAQVIERPVEAIQELVDSLKAQFLVVHTNPLQECIQPEGTPQFRGGMASLKNLCSHLSVPVVLKETGCGFSQKSLQQLNGLGLAAVDVAGRGGTHWGRVEGLRQDPSDRNHQAAEALADWGISTVDSLLNARQDKLDYEVWASGGVGSGLDAAKSFVLGAHKVGFARPLLQAVMHSEQKLLGRMEKLEFELKVAMFCMGIEKLESLIGEESLWKKK